MASQREKDETLADFYFYCGNVQSGQLDTSYEGTEASKVIIKCMLETGQGDIISKEFKEMSAIFNRQPTE